MIAGGTITFCHDSMIGGMTELQRRSECFEFDKTNFHSLELLSLVS